jgi:hypothetical protein
MHVSALLSMSIPYVGRREFGGVECLTAEEPHSTQAVCRSSRSGARKRRSARGRNTADGRVEGLKGSGGFCGGGGAVDPHECVISRRVAPTVKNEYTHRAILNKM